MRRVLVVFGTRPEAVKMAPVIAALRSHVEVRICVTAQHRGMLDQVLEVFDLRPHRDLDLMQPGQAPIEIAQRTLEGLRGVLADEQPDAVVVQGDTTTSFAAALAAGYAAVPVAHVEAGLRSGDAGDPFPEETHRRLIAQIARWHFAPTEKSRRNLLREGVADDDVFVVGNPGIDALLSLVRRLEDGEMSRPLPPEVSPATASARLILLTAHRRESYGAGLAGICAAARSIVAAHEDVAIVFPVHPNPTVHRAVTAELGRTERVYLSPPLDYLAFVEIMRRAHLILTDSGGVQEEAPSLRKPVLVLRRKTERPEGIAAGVARLVGTAAEPITEAVMLLLGSPEAYAAMVAERNPYGDGRTGERIARILAERLG